MASTPPVEVGYAYCENQENQAISLIAYLVCHEAPGFLGREKLRCWLSTVTRTF